MKFFIIFTLIFCHFNLFASDCTTELTQEIQKLEKKLASIKGVLKKHQLPTKGKIRFVPPKNYKAGQRLKKGPSGGFIDRFGNEWVQGPSRTKGQAFEWDVQLSAKGKSQLGHLSHGEKKAYINVSLDGKVTH